MAFFGCRILDTDAVNRDLGQLESVFRGECPGDAYAACLQLQ